MRRFAELLALCLLRRAALCMACELLMVRSIASDCHQRFYDSRFLILFPSKHPTLTCSSVCALSQIATLSSLRTCCLLTSAVVFVPDANETRYRPPGTRTTTTTSHRNSTPSSALEQRTDGQPSYSMWHKGPQNATLISIMHSSVAVA